MGSNHSNHNPDTLESRVLLIAKMMDNVGQEAEAKTLRELLSHAQAVTKKVGEDAIDAARFRLLQKRAKLSKHGVWWCGLMHYEAGQGFAECVDRERMRDIEKELAEHGTR